MSAPSPQNKTKNIIFTVLKMTIAFGLVYWMVAQGTLDLSKGKIFWERPSVLVFMAIVWIVISVGLGTYRWWTLLDGIGLRAPFKRTMTLQLVGMFFNSFVPGAVGGDLMKAFYVMRDHDTKRKTPAMVTVLLDRIIGVMGLFTIGVVSVLCNLEQFWSNALTKSLVTTIFLAFVCMIAAFTAMLIPYKEGRDPFAKILSLRVKGFTTLKKIYEALRFYRNSPIALVKALAISIVIQMTIMVYFMYITRVMTGQTIDLLTFGTIYPIAMVTTALPIAPGGLGVGNVAFEHMYALAGVSGGGNVFFVFFLGQMAFNLLGVFPYLFMKGRVDRATITKMTSENDEQQALA